MSYSDPKQETGGSMNSENRQLAETVVTPLPDSSGLLVQDKAPVSLNGLVVQCLLRLFCYRPISLLRATKVFQTVRK